MQGVVVLALSLVVLWIVWSRRPRLIDGAWFGLGFGIGTLMSVFWDSISPGIGTWWPVSGLVIGTFVLLGSTHDSQGRHFEQLIELLRAPITDVPRAIPLGSTTEAMETVFEFIEQNVNVKYVVFEFADRTGPPRCFEDFSEVPESVWDADDRILMVPRTSRIAWGRRTLRPGDHRRVPEPAVPQDCFVLIHGHGDATNVMAAVSQSPFCRAILDQIWKYNRDDQGLPQRRKGEIPKVALIVIGSLSIWLVLPQFASRIGLPVRMLVIVVAGGIFLLLRRNRR